MTGSLHGLPPRRDTGIDERRAPQPTNHQEPAGILPAAHIVRRTAPASKPDDGHYPVALRASLDPDALPRRVHKPSGKTKKWLVTTLDRPRSFRDDLGKSD